MKLEPDFSEGNVSYNPDGTLNRAETKSILGPHSAIACNAAFYTKITYGSRISIGTMGPPAADSALRQAQVITDADELNLYSDRIFAGADTLATAEVLRTGIINMLEGGGIDIVFSGHRASDGETGQTGPQTAWKLGYTFLGNVIDFSLDLKRNYVIVKRLIALQGFDGIVEEVEAPLPVFITVDPSYRSTYHTISQRLAFAKYRKEAIVRANNFKQFFKIYDGKSLQVDPKFVGLPGSPTIVYRVEKIPRAKASRKTLLIEGQDTNAVKSVVPKLSPIVR
ncbi:MAG: electron transfer flavoprotein subunit beta [Thermoproteota archaeon]|nr:electron transfer flavoprotein subunit beta [Thermoproteota archaeon]